MMDPNDKLEEIHKDVRAIDRKIDEHTRLHHEQIGLMSSIYNVLISMRDNTWHQYKRLTERLQELLGWDKKGG